MGILLNIYACGKKNYIYRMQISVTRLNEKMIEVEQLVIILFDRYHMGGSCLCVSSRKQFPMKHADFSQYPDDLNQFTPEKIATLPKLQFSALLYNIVLVNYPKGAVSLKFQIQDIVEVLLPRKSKLPNSNEIKWIVKEKFTFVLDQYQLRRKFLVVSLTDHEGKDFQQLRINLYKIATGPYHNDFCLPSSKADQRLRFDMKVSQSVDIGMKCSELLAELNEKSYPGQKFNFTIRVLKQEHEEPFESNPSYTKMNPYQKSQKPPVISSEYDECPSPIKIRGKHPSKPLNSKCSFKWQSNNGEMPNFTISIKSDQTQKAILHFVIWRTTEGEGDRPKGQNQDGHMVDMFCEAHIPLMKILQKDLTVFTDEIKNLVRERRGMLLQNEELWSDGQKIGRLSIKLMVQNNKFIKQMTACTRTEAGIIQSTPLFRSYFTNTSKDEKLQKWAKIEEELIKIQNLNKQINQNKQLSYYHSQKLKDKMIEQFQKIKEICEKDLQSSFYVPSTQDDATKMMEEQKVLLSIVLRVMGYAQDNESLTDVCWRIINAILTRGEFELNNIGFNKTEQAQIKNGPSHFIKKKLKVALEFQEIQYKLLVQSLRIGYIEGREDPRQAVQMFRAYAYFRVPIYRQTILKKVVRKQDLGIQWNTNITDEDIETLPEAQNILSTQLDWENNFYKPLLTEGKSEALTKQMVENLEGSLWIEQIAKRGSVFFYFLYFLVSKLSELGKRIKFIKWQYFPGYNKLVRAFLLQMKNIRIERYPPSMVQTSIYLLNNQKLLNILMGIVFDKTNSYDPNPAMKGLDLLSRYLNHFSKNKKLLPPSFNYVQFLKAVKIVLEGEFSYSIGKMLSIIFMNYDNFNIEFRRNLSFYLLGRVFFKLFLHWSFTIRKAFYHVLILKIQRASDIFDPSSRKQFSNKHQIMNQISAKYNQSMKIVRNALRVKNQQQTDKFRRNDKQLYKNLKRKIALKKKKLNALDSQVPQKKVQIKRQGDYSSILSKNNSNNKYSLHQLGKTNQLERSYSVMLDRNKLKPFLDLKKVPSIAQQQQEQMAEVRTRSGTSFKNMALEQEKINKPQKKRERRRSIYGMDEFEMKEIEKKQIEYLELAISQFDDLESAIRKYYLENHELPICELGVEVPIDEKQIKPLSADFQEWQASETDQT